MKLAEALIERADLQRRMEQLKARVLRNAKVQDGDNPAEDPKELLKELETLSLRHEDLVKRINRTNAKTNFENNATIADVIATRDRLKALQNIHNDLAQESTVTQVRFSRSEVKFKSVVDVASVQKKADTFAREYRELDNALQALNWTTELLD